MSPAFPMVALGDIAEFINGKAFKPSDWSTTGRRIIRIQNLNDPSKPFNRTTNRVDDRYVVYPGELLVSWSASLGVFKWNQPDPALLNQHIFRVVPNKRLVFQGYLRYALKRALRNMAKHTHGSTMKHVNRGEFLGTKIPLPPLEEQKRIAAILDKADAVRCKRQESIRLTEEFLKSVFLDMFGDPVTNPKGWPIVKMNDVVSETQYGTSDKANTEKEGLPVLRMNNITYNGEIDVTNLKWCPIAKEDEDKYTVLRGDLLFNRTNSPELVGKTAVWRSKEKYAFAGYLVRIRFNVQEALSEYVSAYLNSYYGKKYLFVKARPSNNMSNFSASEFIKIPLLLPPIDIQDRFVKILETVRCSVKRHEQLAKNSDDLFKSLIQRAFNGEL